MGLYQRIQSAWRALMGWGSPATEAVAASGRMNVWSLNQALYDNTIYEPALPYRTQILQTYCGVKDGRGRIIGHFNPTAEIVEAYQNVLPGTWGKELKPIQPDDGTDGSPQPVSPELAEALTRVWRDSNLDTEKARIIRLAALFGTVGLRVSGIPDTDRVVIQADEPSRIFSVEEDSTGNVTAVCLKYKQTQNFGTLAEPDYHAVDVIELVTKEEFSKTVEGVQQLADDARKNTIGFCPYVLLRHKDNGTPFGDWAFRGIEAQIHDINWRITQQGRSINRGQFPKWFLTSGGPRPETIDADGETSVWHVQNLPGTPPPSAEAIVPKIDHAASMNYDMALRDMVRSRAPVLTINDVKLLSGVSGETIAQILVPAKSAIRQVQSNYHHGLIRIVQMGVSLRLEVGLSTVGGSGPGSGDAAYQAGRLAFSFAPTPALPPTTFDQLREAQVGQAAEQAKAQTAQMKSGMISNAQQLREMGYTQAEIEKIQEEKATRDVIPEEDL